MTVRMRTRAIVIVHSHIRRAPDDGVIDLSRDTIEINTSKAVKGAGGCSVTLVPRRNYLNYIYPNDVINIYFDPGDGERGFIRTFFGYVDRIERTEQTSEDGTTQTSFRLACTDVTKPFDMTEIYFNPALQNRKELIDPRFGLSILGGGHALRTRGITAHGSPPDMIESLCQLLMGFGMQWVLPTSYPDSSVIDDNVAKRRQRALARVPNDVLAQVVDLTGGTIENLTPSDDVVNALTKQQTSNNYELQSFAAGVKVDDVIKLRNQQLNKLLENSLALQAYQTVLRESGTDRKKSLIDLIDFSFVEALSMDGFIASASVWVKMGTLASIMYGYANEDVNELFFDLRPVVEDGTDTCFGTQYSKQPDELSINTDGTDRFGGVFKASVAGVQYRPAIVMREYPYSTCEGVDLKNVYITDEGTGSLGFIPFCPIFAVDIGSSYARRVLYDLTGVPEVDKIKGLAIGGCNYEDVAKALRHLDVVPINNKDVIAASLGRSDNDIFNLSAVYANDALQKMYKYLMQEFLPIVTPVSIARNGLRIQEMNTIYANYGRDALCADSGSGIDTGKIRQNLARWALLLDHWNQHNIEYLKGTIQLRGMPEIRVGYRLDWLDRNESYYVESVSHSWKYPGPMTTSITVSRGQRNDPLLAYVPPAVTSNFGAAPGIVSGDLPAGVDAISGGGGGSIAPNPSEFSANGGGNRQEGGRLGEFFVVADTQATRGAAANERTPDADANYLDMAPEADRGARAEYAYPNAAYRESKINPYDRIADTNKGAKEEDQE